MNLKIDKRDIYWEYLCVNVDDVVDSYRRLSHEAEEARSRTTEAMTRGEEEEGYDTTTWRANVERHWNTIAKTLETLVAVPRQTTNPSNGAKFDKFRARVQIQPMTTSGSTSMNESNKFVMLGEYEDTAEEALSCFTFHKQSYVDPVTQTEILVRKNNVISIQTLSELMSKVCNITWDERIRRSIATSEFAILNPDSPPLLWMKQLLMGDGGEKEEEEHGRGGMVDVFRHLYPYAEGRFTCWNQFTQKRYTNQGGRIDYTLVDRSLLKYVERPPMDGTFLRCGGGSNTSVLNGSKLDPMGETAALMAATACGLFESGSYAGGGIASATQRALDTQFVGVPHTGMIYTPPSYSDHIAVSLLLMDTIRDRMGGSEMIGDATTRKSQPHKRQRSISSFFFSSSSRSSSTSSSSSNTVVQPSYAGDKRRPTTMTEATVNNPLPPKKKGLYSFFGKSHVVGNENGGKSQFSTSQT